jgi:N-acyl-D-aspartate/D-glutamate deacylase
MAADLVVFDPDRVIDTATYRDPHRYPEGIVATVVNGQVVALDGQLTGARPGRVLRRSGPSATHGP